MIIPIKCFTCGEVLADKYRYYIQEVNSFKLKNNSIIVLLLSNIFILPFTLALAINGIRVSYLTGING